MFFRLLWVLLVSWLFAGLIRLLTGDRARSRRTAAGRAPAADADIRPPRGGDRRAAPETVLFTPESVVDAKFDEIEEDREPAPPPR